jgi:hypothetical protein
VIGLLLATFLRGRLWGTCSLVIALDTVALAFAVNLGDLHSGGHIVLWGSSLGAVVALFLTFARRREQRRQHVSPAGALGR